MNNVNSILNSSKVSVLRTMSNINFFTKKNLSDLEHVRLGLLRKNSVYRHGVTRFLPKNKWNSNTPNPYCVKIVDIHPLLLEAEWSIYREIIIFHEFIHCLGYLGHNKEFYNLESLWPTINQKKELGQKFMQTLKQKNSTWKWICPKCNMNVLRQRKSLGKYICKKCNCKLIDEAI